MERPSEKESEWYCVRGWRHRPDPRSAPRRFSVVIPGRVPCTPESDSLEIDWLSTACSIFSKSSRHRPASFAAPSFSQISSAHKVSHLASSSLRCKYQIRACISIPRPRVYVSSAVCDLACLMWAFASSNSCSSRKSLAIS